MIKIYLPWNINFVLLKSNLLYLYNSNIFLELNLISFNIFFNKHLHLIQLSKKSVLQQKQTKKKLNFFLFSWDFFFFSKIYFLGKGFKLKKIQNNLYLNFNHSHINLIISQKTILKKIQKNKILIFHKTLQSLLKLNQTILSIKNLSPYTKRGLRIAKQIVYKKRNKSNV